MPRLTTPPHYPVALRVAIAMLAVAMLLGLALGVTGCTAGQPVSDRDAAIHSQIVQAEGEIEASVRIATRLALLNVDEADRAAVAQVMHDIATVLLDVSGDERDPAAPARLHAILVQTLGDSDNPYVLIVQDVYVVAQSRVTQLVEKNFAQADAVTRERAVYAMVVASARGIKAVAADFTGGVD